MHIYIYIHTVIIYSVYLKDMYIYIHGMCRFIYHTVCMGI